MNPENRIDPNNELGLEVHAYRALATRPDLQGLTGEALRDAIRNASFRNEGAHLGEREKMRQMLLGMLNRIEDVYSPEQKRVLDKLMSQCEEAASVWTERFPLEGVPSKSEIIGAARRWLSSLSPEVLQGIIELCPDTAQVVVVPPFLVEQLMKVVEPHKSDHWPEGAVWPPKGWNNIQSDKWKIAITDGRDDMPFDPSIHYVNPDASEDERKARTNEQMVAEYEKLFAQHHLGMMPQYGYIPAAAGKLAQGGELDKHNWTVFRGSQDAMFLPFADYSAGEITLRELFPGESYKHLTCRLWVEGEL